jgi:hypothetical protein
MLRAVHGHECRPRGNAGLSVSHGGKEQVIVEITDDQEEMKATVRASQENTKAAINTIRSEIQYSAKNQVEDVLASVNQQI